MLINKTRSWRSNYYFLNQLRGICHFVDFSHSGSIRVAISWCSNADCEASELVSASHDQIQKADEKNSWFSGHHWLVCFLDIIVAAPYNGWSVWHEPLKFRAYCLGVFDCFGFFLLHKRFTCLSGTCTCLAIKKQVQYCTFLVLMSDSKCAFFFLR